MRTKMRLYLMLFLVGWSDACFENMRCQGTIIIKRDVSKEKPEKSCSSLIRTLKNGVEAFCDGGWTVFQKNTSPDISFDQNWASYEKGFGDFNDSFWLGLAIVHNLTQNRTCRLRVDLWRSSNVQTFAEYSSFSIGSASDNYRLHVSGYDIESTVADYLQSHNNKPFTTKDRDNNENSGNCANRNNNNGAGWWYGSYCYSAKLNRPFGSLRWLSGTYRSSTMKFRCD